jgi:hypothetical protein
VGDGLPRTVHLEETAAVKITVVGAGAAGKKRGAIDVLMGKLRDDPLA